MSRLAEPDPALLAAATAGDLGALDALLAAIEPGVYRLAVRMLGHRDDAADATQEILLKVVTHLATFRGEAAFSTWVYAVARFHLLNAATRARESPEVSLDAMAERLQAGLEFAARGEPQAQTPEDRLAARQLALSCTQGMLMTLDREQRLVYLLATVFDLPSAEAAAVLDISPEAFRQRLARARKALDAFAAARCGLASDRAACRCERQLAALQRSSAPGERPPAPLATRAVELAEAAERFDAIVKLGDAAALMRAHPDYRAPEALRGAIRAVLQQAGFWRDDARPLQ